MGTYKELRVQDGIKKNALRVIEVNDTQCTEILGEILLSRAVFEVFMEEEEAVLQCEDQVRFGRQKVRVAHLR